MSAAELFDGDRIQIWSDSYLSNMTEFLELLADAVAGHAGLLDRALIERTRGNLQREQYRRIDVAIDFALGEIPPGDA